MASTPSMRGALSALILDGYVLVRSAMVSSTDGIIYDNFVLICCIRRKLPPSARPPSIHDAMDAKQPEQVLLDQNAIIKAAGSQFLAVGSTAVRCGECLAAASLCSVVLSRCV